jgi:choline dehydrogenase-like flavoprotein
MFVNYTEHERGTEIETPICIIGAGAAGITLALELAKSKINTILLESGGFENVDEIQELYDGSNSGKDYPIYGSRLRYFGGTTNHWGGMCRPFDKEDFEKRKFVRYSGWPFTKKDLDPYYKMAHSYLDLGKYDYSLDEGRRITKSRKKVLFEESTYLNSEIFQRSKPTRFLTKYKDKIEKNKFITCICGLNAIEILLNDNKSGCKAIKTQSLDGHDLILKAKRFVICMGGLETPRLLLNSQKDFLLGVGNQHDLVGRFFQEHPHLYSGELIVNPGVSLNKFLDGRGEWISSKRRNPSAIWPVYRINKTLAAQQKILNGSFTLRGGMQKKTMIPQNVPSLQTTIDGLTQEINNLPKADMNFPRIPIFSRTESAPNPNSRVTLTDEKDKLGQRKLNLNWELDELDIISIFKTLKILNYEAVKLGIGRVQLNQKFGEFDIWGGAHHMGTTRMHNSPKMGVVDKNLRVHGLDNLFIASSSVFPTSGFANPTLGITALAIRLAKHLSLSV